MCNEKLTNKLKSLPHIKRPYREWIMDKHPNDRMRIVVYHWGEPVVTLYVGEMIEMAGRNNVLKHVAECDNSYWLKDWQDEKDDVLVQVLSAPFHKD